MITKGKTTALTGLPVDEALFKTENELKDEAILKLLAVNIILFRPLCRKRKRRNDESYDVYLHI